ncbi:hypothetical protein ACWGTO_14475 [Mesorhizobium sp. PL10]
MSSRTIFLSRLIGLFTILVSLSVFLHKQSMVEFGEALVHDRPLLLILGMITLIGGLAMVLCHNVWSGGALPIIVTLFGWSILIRGLLLLFLPDTIASLFEMVRFGDFFYIVAAISFVLGLYLTYGGFTSLPGAKR